MEKPSHHLSCKDLEQIRLTLDSCIEFRELAGLFQLAGNETRLKLIYVLHRLMDNHKFGAGVEEGELAEMLGLPMSALSSHLSKLKAHGLVTPRLVTPRLVKPRRSSPTTYYKLSEHEFNGKLLQHFFTGLPGF